MNKERLLLLAEHLEKPETAEHFDLSYYFYRASPHEDVGTSIHLCGTTACVAGHAIALFSPEYKPTPQSAFWAAVRVLDLEEETACNLFLNWDDNYSAAEAARVVRHLAETGEVRWSRARCP